jgi:hypothetical protein
MGGAADYGLARFYRTNLANAVAAGGGEYAYFTGVAVTSANIQTVIQNMMFLPAGAAANLSVNVTGPHGYCVATGYPTTMSLATPGSVCASDGTAAGTYVIITATYTNIGLMRGFMSTISQPITETATVRLN